MNRTTSGASGRNKVHIVAHVSAEIENQQRELVDPRSLKVLEVASGTGEHAHYFNTEIPGIAFFCTDLNI